MPGTKSILAHLVLLCAFAGAAPAHADRDAGFQFDTSGQLLTEALKQYAQTTNQSLIFTEDLVAGVKANVLKGTYTAETALEKLLQGTGLVAVRNSAGALQIRQVAEQKASASAPAPGTSAPDAGLRIVRVDTLTGPQPDSAAPAKPLESKDDSYRGVPEMLVKGQRSSNTDIRRTEDDVQPYVVFDAEDIRNSMASDLDTFLKTRLPMNQTYEAESQSISLADRGGQSSINLRGLGADETLILVNGRRMPSVTNGLEFFQPDINGIPLSSVERIEVLPSTAGGIYGGGATGGVVNIILKRDYRGAEVAGTFDGTMAGGGARRRLDASAGFTLENGRTSIMLTGSYQESDPLLVGDREELFRPARQLFYSNNRAGVYAGFYPPPGYTTNIKSASGADLVLKSTGQSLGSPVASVPVGYAGPASDGGAAFMGTAGTYNIDLPDTAIYGTRNAVLSNPTVRAANVSLRREFTDRVEAFVDLSHYDNESRSRFAREATQYTLPDSAANPFTEAVRLRVPLAGLDFGSMLTSVSETQQIGGGLIVRLPRSWSVQAEYAWSRSRGGADYSADQITSDGKAAMIDGRLDPLRDVNARPLDFSPYYFTPDPNVGSSFNTVLKDTTLRLAGPVWALPGGPVVLSALAENREQMTSDSVQTRHNAPDVPTHEYRPPAGSTTDSFYIETTAPLVSASNARPGIRGLDLQASYRHDSTETRHRDYQAYLVNVPSPDGPFPDVPTRRRTDKASQYTLGLRYRPTADLTLRASFGEGILAPGLQQLAPLNLTPSVFLRNFLNDPKRGNEALSSWMGWTIAGSFDLVPEQSRSWSAGMILTPEFLQGFRLSVDYTLITKTDEIGSISYGTMVELEDQGFADRITRGPLTPEDAALGFTVGPIIAIDSGNINIARTELEAFDIQADYTWETAYGVFTANLVATYQPHYKQQLMSSLPESELVGYTDGPLKWRGNGGVNWRRGPWMAGWNMQYYDEYFVYGSSYSQSSRDAYVLGQGSSIIPSQTYHDMFARYRFDDTNLRRAGWLANSEVLVSVQNVFDDVLPLLATTGLEYSGYSLYGDPRLRRYSISFTKRFGL